jgi:osmotically-inducible protein OsmY
MKPIVPLIAVFALAAAGVTGCNKHTGTAYNNSGGSATPGSTATASTTAPTSSDSSSPNSANTSSSPSSTDTSTSTSSGPNMVADTATTGKVRLALANEPNLKDADIGVKTDSGVVTLSGTAKSQDQVTTAQNVAQKQEGVSSVNVQIAVR